MVLRKDRAKAKPTSFLGESLVTEEAIETMVKWRLIMEGTTCAPPWGQVAARPEDDETVVFKNFFIVRLHFPLDAVVVDIFRLYGVYMHQMTPNSFLQLSLYLWLTRTCCLSLSAEGFAYAHMVHYQPKTMVWTTGRKRGL